LVCSHNQLTNLNIKNCPKLRRVVCNSNQLVNLDLIGLNELEVIDCSDNFLTDLDYSILDPAKLICLNISNNNLSKQNLSIFSQFVNLKVLMIGNDKEDQIQVGTYNR